MDKSNYPSLILAVKHAIEIHTCEQTVPLYMCDYPSQLGHQYYQVIISFIKKSTFVQLPKLFSPYTQYMTVFPLWKIILITITIISYLIFIIINITNLNLHLSITPLSVQFSSVQLLSRVQLFATPWISAHQASLSITNTWSLLKLMSIESVMPSSHLILCHPLLLLPPIPPSIRVFSNESILRMRWPKYWSFSFSVSPSNEHSGLISFRMNRLDLLAVQGTLKSHLQHHSSKASIFRHSAFFTVQLSHPHMTTGKTTALTRRTFVGKVMSLLFNMLSRLVITFLPRN